MAKFEKGQSGNPGGRPKEVAEVRELAREHTPEAVNTLAEIMLDKDAPPAARISAATALLDRGYGRPAGEVPQVAVQINTDNSAERDMTQHVLRMLTNEQLAELHRIGLALEASPI